MDRDKAALDLTEGIDSLNGGGKGSFRLLDLPKELRLLIYEYCVTDIASSEKVPFYQLRRVLPDPALLRVARQVRNESLKPYKKATEEFWRSHTICIELKRDRWARAVTFNQGTLIKAECTKILRCPNIKIQRLNFSLDIGEQVYVRPNRIRLNGPLIVDVAIAPSGTIAAYACTIACDATIRALLPSGTEQELAWTLWRLAALEARWFARSESLLMRNCGLDLEACIVGAIRALSDDRLQ